MRMYSTNYEQLNALNVTDYTLVQGLDKEFRLLSSFSNLTFSNLIHATSLSLLVHLTIGGGNYEKLFSY